MNYLAHCFLSGDHPQVQLGGLLGDFCKGPLNHYPWISEPQFRNITFGIELHRKLDAHTDTDPALKQVCALLGPKLRRPGGIILDICFDHFLAKHWQQFCKTDLHSYSNHCYRTMHQCPVDIPPSFERFRQRSQENQLFQAYQDLGVIEQVLERIAQRLSKPQLMDGAFEAVESNYEKLEACFFDVFPKLQHWSALQLTFEGLSHTETWLRQYKPE